MFTRGITRVLFRDLDRLDYEDAKAAGKGAKNEPRVKVIRDLAA